MRWRVTQINSAPEKDIKTFLSLRSDHVIAFDTDQLNSKFALVMRWRLSQINSTPDWDVQPFQPSG